MSTIIAGIAEAALAAVFLFAGTGKLADRKGLQQAALDFGLPQLMAKAAVWVLPWVELLVAIGFFFGLSARLAATVATLLLLTFTVLISVNLARGRRPACHCFGRIDSKPIGWTTLARNFVLLTAAIKLSLLPGLPGLWSQARVLDFTARLILLLTVVAIASIAIVSFFFLHLLRQNGRLLVRLQALEKQMAALTGSRPEDGEPIAGLPIHSPAPPFEAVNTSAEVVSLASLLVQGKPVLMLFTDPHCAACQEIYRDALRWEQEHAESFTTVVIGRHGAKPERGTQLPQYLLLQKDREILDAYNCSKLPSAVLVDTRGRIASPMAVGPRDIREMVQAMLADPSHVWQIAPQNGASGGGALAMGDSAPPLDAVTITGESVSLSSLKGRPVMLLFWNPQCSYCVRIISRLKEWETDASGALQQLVLVSSHPPEHTFQMGLRFPIVADPDSRIRRMFGIEGTPSGLLLDEAGEIASGIAVGSEMVFALAGMRQNSPVGI